MFDGESRLRLLIPLTMRIDANQMAYRERAASVDAKLGHPQPSCPLYAAVDAGELGWRKEPNVGFGPAVMGNAANDPQVGGAAM